MAVYCLVRLQYDLRMLGVQILRPSILFGDNFSMIIYISLTGSYLNKAHNSFFYNGCREATDAITVSYTHCCLALNKINCLTKALRPVFFTKYLSSPLLVIAPP